MHKAFLLPVIEFLLPGEVLTASEESSHCQKKRDATAHKIALLLKSSSNCQSKSYDSYAKANCIESLTKGLELLKKEKGKLETKLTGFQRASKDLDSLLESQKLDKNKEGLGYSVVPPPPAQIYSPPKKDMSWTGLPEFKDDTFLLDFSSSAIFTAVASLFFWQWKLSSLAVETSSSSGNSITGRGNLDEGEAAAERVSDDTEEMATVLTSMETATVLASGAAEVLTGSRSIPTAGSSAAEVPTVSDMVPTASLIFAATTVVTPYTRRKGKEILVESETPKKKNVQEQIDAQVARELEEQMAREDQRMSE
nr:hypothetical protein [Tanacetum cinerariifolium]